ncbi:MAG: fasciclin domain-containing protein [Pirellulaceae bacterium]
MQRTLLGFALTVCCLTIAAPVRAQESTTKTIPETAIAAGNFKTLVKAVTTAGLAETLSGAGPFTVLAPTDEAFAKLPKGTIESLLKPENKEKLVAILKLHVASGSLTSDMAQDGAEFPTLAGALKVGVKGKEISVGSAKVVKADIACSNGVIHVIDSVILPASGFDPKALVGKWSYTSAVKNGEKKTEEQLEGQSVTITEKTWTLDGGGKFVMSYEIDADKSPNTIKFTITESPFGAGMASGGVIKMEGENLVVCYAAQGGKAPEKFASAENSGFHLFTLKKVK